MCVCVCLIACSGSTRKPSTYSVEKELQVLVDRGCYGDVASLLDNYRLIDNNLWLIHNDRDNI